MPSGAQPKSSTILEHVTAIIGSRSYLWALAALALVLIIYSLMSGSSLQVPARAGSAALAGLEVLQHKGEGRSRRRPPPEIAKATALLLPRGAAGIADMGQALADGPVASAAEPEPFIRRLDGCQSPVCRWLGDYLRGKLDDTVDPCTDFYGYACPAAWFSQDTLGALPFQAYAAAQLMYRLENMFHEFQQTDFATEGAKYARFVSRASSFFIRCISRDGNHGPRLDLQELLSHYGLEGFPFKANGDNGLPELSRLVGTLDRDLGLSALFRASLTPVRPSVRGPTPVLFLDPVDSTHSMRYLSATGKENSDRLLELVALGLSFVKKREPQKKEQAIQVMAIDKDLAKLLSGISLSHESDIRKTYESAVFSVQNLARRFDSPQWNWEAYVKTLLQASSGHPNRTVLSELVIDVGSPGHLNSLSRLLVSHSRTALLNFVGFSLVVFLSPALPHGSSVSPLLPLSHSQHVLYVPEQLQACVHLLARTYRFGTRMLARQAILGDGTDPKYSRYEDEMRTLVSKARNVLSELLTRSWLDAAESQAASQNLDTMRTVFLRESEENSGRLQTYYEKAISWKKSATSNMTLLQEYVAQQIETRRLYWSASQGPETNLEARWPELSTEPRAEYLPSRNTLLLAPSLVSFLTGLAVRFDPLVIPILGSQVLRGLLNVLLKSQLFSASSRRERPTDRLLSKRRNLTRCLAEQYGAIVPERVNETLVPEDLLIDTALVEPLILLYKRYLGSYPKLKDQLNIPELPGKNAMELFFINFAVSRCERALRTTSDIKPAWPSVSPAVRVNLAMMNSEVFAKVFHCKLDDPMNTQKKCKIW